MNIQLNKKIENDIEILFYASQFAEYALLRDCFCENTLERKSLETFVSYANRNSIKINDTILNVFFPNGQTILYWQYASFLLPKLKFLHLLASIEMDRINLILPYTKKLLAEIKTEYGAMRFDVDFDSGFYKDTDETIVNLYIKNHFFESRFVKKNIVKTSINRYKTVLHETVFLAIVTKEISSCKKGKLISLIHSDFNSADLREAIFKNPYMSLHADKESTDEYLLAKTTHAHWLSI